MNTCTHSCPFKKYVLTGHGIGLKIVTLVSLIIGLIVGLSAPKMILSLMDENNSLNDFINTLPIITVENGKIVNPVYDNETWIIPAFQKNGNDIKVIANTTVDSIDAIPADVALYITARNIYSSTSVMKIPEDVSTVITHDIMRQMIEKVIWSSGFIIGLMFFVIGIIGFLITFIPTFIMGLAINNKLTVRAWGRVLAWPWSIVYGIAILSTLFASIVITPTYMILIAALISWIIGVMVTAETDQCSCCCKNKENNCSCDIENTNQKEIVLQAVETDTNISEEPTPVPTKLTIEKTAVTKKSETANRTKKATVKPKNIPAVRKSKKKK